MTDTTPTILALDASSTMLGYCIYDGSVFAFGEIALSGSDIADRCRQAHASLNLILAAAKDRAIDCIAIESPVVRFAKAAIPQARVSGALMACTALQGFLVVEVTPGQAKVALTGRGNATKSEMQEAALKHGISGEHASDALGVALSAVKMITVERRKEAA